MQVWAAADLSFIALSTPDKNESMSEALGAQTGSPYSLFVAKKLRALNKRLVSPITPTAQKSFLARAALPLQMTDLVFADWL